MCRYLCRHCTVSFSFFLHMHWRGLSEHIYLSKSLATLDWAVRDGSGVLLETNFTFFFTHLAIFPFPTALARASCDLCDSWTPQNDTTILLRHQLSNTNSGCCCWLLVLMLFVVQNALNAGLSLCGRGAEGSLSETGTENQDTWHTAEEDICWLAAKPPHRPPHFWPLEFKVQRSLNTNVPRLWQAAQESSLV